VGFNTPPLCGGSIMATLKIHGSKPHMYKKFPLQKKNTPPLCVGYFLLKLEELKMEKIYKDEMAMVCHEAMRAAFDIGAISEKEMRKFDKSCLAPTPKQKKRIVRIAKVPVLART
jgi:hypothetical protein